MALTRSIYLQCWSGLPSSHITYTTVHCCSHGRGSYTWTSYWTYTSGNTLYLVFIHGQTVSLGLPLWQVVLVSRQLFYLTLSVYAKDTGPWVMTG